MGSDGEQTPPPKNKSIKLQLFLEWIRPASANGRSLQFSAAAPGGCTPLKRSLSWNKGCTGSPGGDYNNGCI